MKNTLFAATLAAVAAAVPAVSLAQAAHQHPTPSGTAAKAAPAEGEIRAVDRSGGTVVIKHGPLAALNMGPMTMEFVAKDPALLANLKPGDKVRFTVERGKDGALVVTTLQLVKG